MNKKYLIVLFSSVIVALFFAVISHYFLLKKYSLVESAFIWFPMSVVIALINQTQVDKKQKK